MFGLVNSQFYWFKQWFRRHFNSLLHDVSDGFFSSIVWIHSSEMQFFESFWIIFIYYTFRKIYELLDLRYRFPKIACDFIWSAVLNHFPHSYIYLIESLTFEIVNSMEIFNKTRNYYRICFLLYNISLNQ